MKKKGKQKKHKNIIQFLFFLLLMIFIALGLKVYKTYKDIYFANVNTFDSKNAYIHIPTSSVFKDVKDILIANDYLTDTSSFKWVAKKKKYIQNIKCGRYKISNKMSNNELINLLRSGQQAPVRVIFGKIRTKEIFASIISNQIEADSAELLNLLNNKYFLKKFNKTPHTAMCLFIPNTYELYWNTPAKVFIKRMQKENDTFWNNSRTKRCKDIGLTKDEVYTLASIVEEETIKNDEKKKIAGVYINRLKKKMRLQADPTVKFAIGDFTIKRILKKHLKYDNPYNTYLNAGLPPGPICIPSISSIDAVLNYQQHKYIYFCAKDDFSGYHIFSKNLIQHNINAKRYRRALNKKRIYK